MKFHRPSMPKIFNFTRFSLRDLIVTAGPATFVIVLICLLAYWLVDPTPPSHVTISTGQENSAYEAFAKKYAQALAKQHIRVSLKPSLGSFENLQRLNDPKSGIDIAFVQSGSTEQAEAKRRGLVSLGSLFTEPVWLFYRDSLDITQLSQLKGLRINVGPEGTGVPQLFNNLLSVNGMQPTDLTHSNKKKTPTTEKKHTKQNESKEKRTTPKAPLIQ